MILAEPRPDRRQELARRGEDAAARFLVREGLRLLERRFRARHGEIDLILEDGQVVVFVEVKTRSGEGYGEPGDAVTPRKQRHMSLAALAFLMRRRWLERRCRFDVIEVRTGPGKGLVVQHIPDAFRLWTTG